jgi:F0F1-type ATP synthase, gamma subunit
MASLKDMRVRLASTKATQKITKAMQMVAASKLRRAQAAAEAARPYAERMEKVLGNIAATVADIHSAPRLLAGTGQDQVHLLVVCTAERGLCGAFNSSIVRLVRERISTLTAAGKTFKILCVGRKGADQLRRQYSAQIIEVIELRVKTLGFEHADQVGSKIIALYEKGEFDVATLFFSRFRSVISQTPTCCRSSRRCSRPPPRAARPRSTNTSPTSSTFSPSCCPATSRCRCSARFWKTRHPSRARACRQWTMPPATPAK